MAPTFSPSVAPSLAPSIAPSLAPTRIPTQSDAYDSYMDVTYNVSITSSDYIDYLAIDLINKSIDITELIERGYADHQTYKDDRWEHY